MMVFKDDGSDDDIFHLRSHFKFVQVLVHDAHALPINLINKVVNIAIS